MEELCFLRGPCGEVISETTFRTWSAFDNHLMVSSVVGYSPDSNDVNTEAEESPLLKSVARKRLVKAD
jgi:hypothetical protein